MGQYRATDLMPLFDFAERHGEPVTTILRWGGRVRKAKVPDIGDVVIARRSPRLYYTKDVRLPVVLVFEHGSNTEIFCVSKENFVLLGGPGDCGSLTVSADARP